MGVHDRPTIPAIPWRNGNVERVIGSSRRECQDHLMVRTEMQFRRALSRYAEYYNANRTYPGIAKGSSNHRPIQGLIFLTPIPPSPRICTEIVSEWTPVLWASQKAEFNPAAIPKSPRDRALVIDADGKRSLVFARASAGSIDLGDRSIGRPHKAVIDAAAIFVMPNDRTRGDRQYHEGLRAAQQRQRIGPSRCATRASFGATSMKPIAF
jgi:hypothetical protein